MERRPFSNETIKNLENIRKNKVIEERKNKNIFYKKQFHNKNLDNNYIVLPNVNSKLIVSRTISAKNPSIEKIEKELNNNNDLDYFQINELESGTETLRTNGTVQKKPSRKTLKNVSLMVKFMVQKKNQTNVQMPLLV